MDNQPGITFFLHAVSAVVVNSMGVERDRRIIEQKYNLLRKLGTQGFVVLPQRGDRAERIRAPGCLGGRCWNIGDASNRKKAT